MFYPTVKVKKAHPIFEDEMIISYVCDFQRWDNSVSVISYIISTDKCNIMLSTLTFVSLLHDCLVHHIILK